MAVTTGVTRPGPSATATPDRAAGGASAGRPPWWAMVLAVVVLVAVTADLLAGGLLAALDARVSAVVGGWDLEDGPVYPLLWLGTQLGGRGFILAVLAVLAGLIGWRRRTVAPLLQVLLGFVLLTAVVYGFKYGAGRTAPASSGSYFHWDGESYPSGHVANAVLMWGIAYWQAVRYGVAVAWQRVFRALSVAGPVVAGVSMVALDFHWATDVVAGAAVGVLLLGVVHALHAFAMSRWVRARAGQRSA